MIESSDHPDFVSGQIAEYEAKIGELWVEILQPSESIDSGSNFFALGGDSLAMMMMLFRASQEYGVEILPEVLLEDPATLNGFCTRIHRLCGGRLSGASEDANSEQLWEVGEL